MKKIYLDHNATTPVHPDVFDAMVPYLKELWGNPSSIHWAAREPRKAIDDAREQVAQLINCKPNEIVFTSSGSEGNNFALKGVAYAKKDKGNHIITTSVEHPAVLNTCKYLTKVGFEVSFLSVDSSGMVDLEELKSSITDKTILISIMFANNETGNIFPVEEIGRLAKGKGVLFHCDAVQAAGKVPIDVERMNIGLLTLSGHKLHAPKGVGALYIRKGVRLVPLIHGGHHERNRRAGTENVSSIVGFGKACKMAGEGIEERAEKLTFLRDKLQQGIMERIDHVRLNGHPINRLCTTLNVSFEYVEGESLLLNLDMKGVAASSGSACTSGSLEPSHVLLAMGIPMEVAHGSLRFSLGTENSVEDIDYVLEVLPPIVDRLRSMSPLYEKGRIGG